jgi:hypothetical protein
MKYPYGKIQKLSDSLDNNGVGADLRSEIMRDGEKIKQTDKNEKKAAWFHDAMTRMEAKLDPATRYKIREGCACCLGGKRHEICKEINKTYTTKKERIEAADMSSIILRRCWDRGWRCECSPRPFQRAVGRGANSN